MKKNFFPIAVCILGLLSVQGSCRRDNSDLPFTESGDSTYISSIVGYDSAAFHSDTVIRIHFTYDGDKRISTVREEVYLSNTTSLSFTTDYRYHYNGTDSLPNTIYTKLTNYVGGPVTWSHDTVYLAYDNGVIVKDSTVVGGTLGGFHHIVYSFIRTANQVYTMYRKDHNGGSPTVSYSRLYTNWVNGNLLEETDSFYHVPTTSWRKDTGNYLYDNHPNPLQRVMFRLPAHTFRKNMTEFTALGPYLLSAYWLNTTNNVVRDDSSIPSEVIHWTYTYRANGLPKTALRNAWGNYRKFLFHYTDL